MELHGAFTHLTGRIRLGGWMVCALRLLRIAGSILMNSAVRALCADDLSLGVVWYLVPNEGADGNGTHVGYLDPTPANLRRFKTCDPPLYDALGEIVLNGTRSVRSISGRAILPPGTVFYEEPLSFDGTPGIGPPLPRHGSTTGAIGSRELWRRPRDATSFSPTPTTAWSPGRRATIARAPSSPTSTSWRPAYEGVRA